MMGRLWRRVRKAGYALGALLFVAGGAVAVVASGRYPELADAVGSFFSPASSASFAGDIDAAPPDASAPKRQSAPLSSAQLGAPLVHGGFVTACGAPETMKVVAKVDVKMGRATSVNVKTDPVDPTVAACVERVIRDMQWDVSPKVGHATVTY